MALVSPASISPVSNGDEVDDVEYICPYKKITDFLYSVKLSNLVKSISYCGAELDPMFCEKKEMVIEAYLVLVEQIALEDIVFFLSTDSLYSIMRSLGLIIESSRDNNEERMIDYMVGVGLYSFIHSSCTMRDIVLLCTHLDIPMDPNDCIHNEEDKNEGKEVTLIPNAFVKKKYCSWLMEEVVYRGFRSSMFEQSLAMTREWMRDIKGPVAGSKIVIVERALCATLSLDPENIQEITDEQNTRYVEIADRLRVKAKPARVVKKKKTPKATRKPVKKKKKKKKLKARRKVPSPHPNTFEQKLEFNGQPRPPILKGIESETILTLYNHVELRTYCSFFHLNQTGKKVAVVHRILDFLDNYDYENGLIDVDIYGKRVEPEPEDSESDGSDQELATTGKRAFKGGDEQEKKRAKLQEDDNADYLE